MTTVRLHTLRQNCRCSKRLTDDAGRRNHGLIHSVINTIYDFVIIHQSYVILRYMSYYVIRRCHTSHCHTSYYVTNYVMSYTTVRHTSHYMYVIRHTTLYVILRDTSLSYIALSYVILSQIMSYIIVRHMSHYMYAICHTMSYVMLSHITGPTVI